MNGLEKLDGEIAGVEMQLELHNQSWMNPTL
jgi:hypothetical protein